MKTALFRVAALFGFVSIAAGAFGAHALRDQVSPERLEAFQTGVRYMMFHVPVLLLISLFGDRLHARRSGVAGWLMVAGTVLFSGSLFLIVLFDQSRFGMLTPIGGVVYMAAWLSLASAANGRTE